MINRSTLLLSFALLCLLSCSKEQVPGQINFTVDEEGVSVIETKASVSDFVTLPSEGSFSIEIKDASAKQVWKGLLSDWDPQTKLKAGDYSVEAAYGDPEEEGYGKPCFKGGTSFTVTAAEVVNVKIPVSLSNCIVKILCTEMFRNYYPSYAFTITTGSGNVIAASETQGAFIDAYRFTLDGTMTSQSGKTVTLPSKTYSNLQAAVCYTVKMDAPTVGGMSVTITFDDTVETYSFEEELND